jgi:hypothetical protein
MFYNKLYRMQNCWLLMDISLHSCCVIIVFGKERGMCLFHVIIVSQENGRSVE